MTTWPQKDSDHGPEWEKGRAHDLRLSPALWELVRHMAHHSDLSPDELASMTLLLGVGQIAVECPYPCLHAHFVQFIGRHGKNYGLDLEQLELPLH